MPFNAKTRSELMDSDIGVDFEWLAELERFIAIQEAALRDLEAMRTLIVAPSVPASVAAPSLPLEPRPSVPLAEAEVSAG